MGCMAERIKEKIIDQEQLVDIVVGPDAYRDIPSLLAEVNDGRKAVNVLYPSKKRTLTLPRSAPATTASPPLYPSCAAATICAPFAWCRLHEVANAAGRWKVFCGKFSSSATRAIKK